MEDVGQSSLLYRKSTTALKQRQVTRTYHRRHNHGQNLCANHWQKIYAAVYWRGVLDQLEPKRQVIQRNDQIAHLEQECHRAREDDKLCQCLEGDESGLPLSLLPNDEDDQADSGPEEKADDDR